MLPGLSSLATQKLLAHVRAGFLGFAAAVAVTACSNGAPAASDAALKPSAPEAHGEGRVIAETLCASCHSIERMGFSPHPDAKPFRDFSENYPIRSLAEAFAEGIMVGHPDMPMFQFEPEDIDPLLAYIQSLQSPKEI